MVVLTIDDDSRLCKPIFTEIFGKGSTWKWSHFEDLDQAWEYLEGAYSSISARPHLIILDVQLQDQEEAGLVLLKRLRRLDSYPPVVMLSVSRAKPIISSSYRSGARVFVTKPATRGSLKSVVESIAAVWQEAYNFDDSGRVLQKKRALRKAL